ncbi:MAG: hypothetical protein DRJ50_02555 [Actinobacteria bacterium]|nr:MAG: hypothetical protein DRJ50_02555 [Actinomycetota bacterium]
MFQYAWRGVRYNKGRYIATLVAIITGVAFFTATGFLSDRVIDSLEGSVDREFGSVDVAVVVDADADAVGSDFAADLRISGDDADQIIAADGVDAGAGVLTGSVAFLGDDGKTFADDAVGRLWIEDDELNPLDLEDGVAPAGEGEIAVDRGIAESNDLEVGSSVTVLTLAGQFDATVVGITKFGSADSIDGTGTVSIPAESAFDWLSSGQVEFEDVYLRGSVDQAELQSTIEPLVPAGFMAQTGDEYREDQQAFAAGVGKALKRGLQAFALLAMLVGGFVIYNTFSVIVAQRLRELAVLAAIGATPKQLKRSLRYEGLVIGILGSAMGVLAGLALTYLLIFVLKLSGVELPGGGIKVSGTTVLQGMVIGALITFLSVMIPARRAARTEPMEALRQAAVETGTLSRNRAIAAGALSGLGALGMLFGGSAAVGFGMVALFAGVIVGGPFIAAGVSRLLRPLLSRLGLEGRLATDNTARNPQRTATTANALLIGVFLVTLVTVAGTSIKDFAVGEINKLSSADYTLESTGGSIDDDLVADLEAIDGVAEVIPFRSEAVTIDGNPSALSTGDISSLTEVADIDISEGSLDDLGPSKVAVIDVPDSGHVVGSTVTLADISGETVELEVVALISFSLDTLTVGNVVDMQTFDSFVGDTAPTKAFVKLVSGAQTDTQDAIEDLTNLRPDIILTHGNELGELFGTLFDFLINAVNGLLLMSVLIALIGIVNTLSLSILERRRELGLLRVIGMVDKQVRRMVRLESVLIASQGTVTGLLLGMFTGAALIFSIGRLSDADISISLPGYQLLMVLVLGIGLGFLASIIPAHRSTHLEVLEAIGAN